MLLVCESLEIPIILYIRIILKGTELVVRVKNIRIVVEEISKIGNYISWKIIIFYILSANCQP